MSTLLALTLTSTSASRQKPARTGDELSVEAAFQGESAAPGGTAVLRFFAAAHGVVVQIFHAGPERIRTRRGDVMHGVAVTPRRWLGSKRAASDRMENDHV